MKKLQLLLLASLALLLIACSNGGGSQATASPTPAVVNGFGTSQNHVHSLVILPDAHQTMVLATHYGIFRSQDHGATWQETAGGPGQPMQGVMTYNLSYNPLDPQRLYVLTFYQTGTVPHGSYLGLYTSGDGGQTWQLSVTDASVSSSTIFFAQAGNDSPSEVYIYLRERGPLGLRVSKDNGQHFAQTGSPLPFSSLEGLLPIPGEPGHLVAFGDEGIATTTDDGSHWKVVSALQDSIYEATTGGAKQPIYARGDAGIYVSRDDGQSFKLVYTQHSYSSLTVSPENPAVLYGKLALGVYRSSDGGQSWQQLPAIKGNLAILAADPGNASQVYLALSYPSAIYRFQNTNHAWQSLTPAASR